MNGWWARKAIEHAKSNGADVILHVGDFGMNFEKKTFKIPVQKALEEADLHLYFVGGNHENWDYLDLIPRDEDGMGILKGYDRIHFIPTSTRWTWWGKVFCGIGGAVSVDKYTRTPGVSWWPQEALSWANAEKIIEGGPIDVVLAHDTFSTVAIPGINASTAKFWPDDLIKASDSHRDMMDVIRQETQPRLWVHGHYHVWYVGKSSKGGRTISVGLDMDATKMDRNLWFLDYTELIGDDNGPAK